jgi:tetratricopeptide (TPR) repeat protein
MMPEVERHWAELSLKTNELDQALDHINRSIELAVTLSSPREEGVSRRVLGQVHQARGEWELAGIELGQSLQILSDLDSKYHLAKTRLALASLMTESGKLEKAQTYLHQATETFEKLGAKADLAEARKLAQRGGSADAPPQ